MKWNVKIANTNKRLAKYSASKKVVNFLQQSSQIYNGYYQVHM